MRIAIITALFGDRDILEDPKIVHSNIDYYAFVDKKYNCKIWQQKDIFDFTIDDKYRGRRNAKIYKILPQLFLPDYDYWFWVDPTHEVVEKPEIIIESYLKKNDIAVWKHTARNCAYQEANEIINLNYDHLTNICELVGFLNLKGFPKNYGLYELSSFIRKNTTRIQLFNIKWWEIICKYSSRDQISFPFLLWKLNIIPTILPGYINGYNENGQLGCNNLIPQKRTHLT